MNKRIFEYDEYIRSLDNNVNIFSKKNKYNIKYINSNIFLITGGKIYKEFRVPFLDEYILTLLSKDLIYSSYSNILLFISFFIYIYIYFLNII